MRLGVVPQARHAASRFAGTKFTSWAMNLTMYDEAHDRGLDEVVLLNERDEVSECTSANIFIVEGDQVFTPPAQFRLPRRHHARTSADGNSRSRHTHRRKSTHAPRSGNRQRSLHHFHNKGPACRSVRRGIIPASPWSTHPGCPAGCLHAAHRGLHLFPRRRMTRGTNFPFLFNGFTDTLDLHILC